MFQCDGSAIVRSGRHLRLLKAKCHLESVQMCQINIDSVLVSSFSVKKERSQEESYLLPTVRTVPLYFRE